jgi:hypothetical protein
LSVFATGGLSDVVSLQKIDRWPPKSELAFTRMNGGKNLCEVINISLHGVTLSTPERPPLHELVFWREVRFVVRHLEGGIAIEFLKFLYNQKEYRLSGVAL